VKVSIVINTDGRAGPLATCLESLRYLRYPDFEVVVVAGPTRDGTHELCEAWAGSIKYGLCPARNLSQSRNIGIAMAAGDIVAYIDDDAVPEPEWLDDIVRAFEDPQVGVAGGFVHDHTGKEFQWKYGTTDRFGKADEDWTGPAPEFNFPFSFNVQCQGTADTTLGGACQLTTTADSVLPGSAPEGNRSIWAFDQVRVYEWLSYGAQGPLFAVQGVFVP